MRRWADPPAPHRNPLQARTPAPATEVNPSAATGHAGGYFSPLYFFLLSFLFLAPTFMRIASTISSATCSPSALLLLPAVKNANLCIERTLQTQPLYTRALPGTSVAPILLPFPLLILSNHRRCVSSLFSSIGQLEFFLDLPGIFYLTTPK